MSVILGFEFTVWTVKWDWKVITWETLCCCTETIYRYLLQAYWKNISQGSVTMGTSNVCMYVYTLQLTVIDMPSDYTFESVWCCQTSRSIWKKRSHFLGGKRRITQCVTIFTKPWTYAYGRGRNGITFVWLLAIQDIAI